MDLLGMFIFAIGICVNDTRQETLDFFEENFHETLIAEEDHINWDLLLLVNEEKATSSIVAVHKKVDIACFIAQSKPNTPPTVGKPKDIPT